MPTYEFRSPAEATAAVANTTAGRYTFTPPVERILLSNWSGTEIYVRFNSTSAASTTACDAVILANDEKYYTRDMLGTAISSVGIWFPSGSVVTQYTLRGL